MPRTTHSDGYALLLQSLLSARSTAGVTQVALSETLGKPQSFVSKFERGERRLDLIEVVAVLRALGVDEVKFFKLLLAALPAELEI